MTKGKLSLIAASVAASLALATALFWARMLISPPVTEAATIQGVEVGRLTFNASNDLPSFDDSYQRHTGVLDTLKP
jgi:hypothetical protein